MILKVRTHPMEVFYLTGDDARAARDEADSEGDGPCFVTAMMGADGFAWDTAESFEYDYEMTFGKLAPGGSASTNGSAT
jgi:hypothetical protein